MFCYHVFYTVQNNSVHSSSFNFYEVFVCGIFMVKCFIYVYNLWKYITSDLSDGASHWQHLTSTPQDSGRLVLTPRGQCPAHCFMHNRVLSGLWKSLRSLLSSRNDIIQRVHSCTPDGNPNQMGYLKWFVSDTNTSTHSAHRLQLPLALIISPDIENLKHTIAIPFSTC